MYHTRAKAEKPHEIAEFHCKGRGKYAICLQPQLNFEQIRESGRALATVSLTLRKCNVFLTTDKSVNKGSTQFLFQCIHPR